MRSIVAALLLVVSVPVAAQDAPPLDKRVGKLESEMRAVQRKVFPGGDPRFFEPEIQAPAAAPATPAGIPASAPLADLTARVDALEAQVQTLTGQVEANQFKLKQLEEQMTKLRGDTEFRLNTLEGGGAAGTAATGAAAGAANAAPKITAPAPRTPAAAAKAPAAAPKTADAAWTAAYGNVTKKDWPATEAAMTQFAADWPKSPRAAQAQFWLGRSHAARAQHAQAARAYLEVYKSAPRSPQAPDALVGLATALNGMTKPKDACRVLDELDSVYADKLKPEQQTAAKAQRAKAKCG